MKISPVTNYYYQPVHPKSKHQNLCQQLPVFKGKKEIMYGALAGYLFGAFFSLLNNAATNPLFETYTTIVGAFIGALVKDKEDNGNENDNNSNHFSGSC